MSIAYYRGLLRQSGRIEAFRAAIRATVRPGDRVLDVGTALGTYAFFAADAGAARVWAVDGDPIIAVARQVARVNGYDDRVTLIRGWVPDVALPEPADVLIFEDFPTRGVDETVFDLLRALHARYAAPGARTVPSGLRFCLAPVRAERIAAAAPLGPDDVAYGICWEPSRRYVGHAPVDAEFSADALAAPPAEIGRVGLQAAPASESLAGTAAWRLEETCAVGGLAYWFDLDLAPGIVLSNAPGSQPAPWGHLLLPLEPALEVRAGEVVRAAVRPEHLPYGAPGWLRWEACSGSARVAGHEFNAAPAALGDLLAASADGIPELGGRGRLEAAVLVLTDGQRSLREIAEALAASYPAMSQAELVHAVARTLRGRATAGLPQEVGI